MGGGLTVPETANEEECRAFAECAGVEFDAARFTELAVETGVGGELAVTRSQLNELSIPVSNSSDAEANTPAEVVRQPPSPPAIKILLPELVETVEQVFSAGLTPLILDPSHGHNVDTFFRYSNTSIFDAKRIGLDVAMGVASEAEGLEEARRALVVAMKRGKSLVVSMQQASPPFSSWLNHPDYFPAQEAFTNAGQALATFDSDWPDRLFRDEDTADTHGFAIAHKDFRVVLTSWFSSASDANNFFFDEGKGLENFQRALFQPIVVVDMGDSSFPGGAGGGSRVQHHRVDL